MNPPKTLLSWESTRVPVELAWNQVETICNWLRKNYGFDFHPAEGGGSHYILAHDLLRKHKQALINNGYSCGCNNKGEYSLKRESKVKSIYLRNILQAYKLVKGLKNE